MEKELIKCSQIKVDCVHNDPVDIKAGGPAYLGFDLFIKSEEAQEMVNFITITLQEYKIPFVNIEIDPISLCLTPDRVWTKEKIKKCIKKEASYLIHEASRGYSYTKSRI